MNYEQIIDQKDRQIVEIQNTFSATVESLQKKILILQDQIYQLQRMVYGRKSERFVSTPAEQLNLFNQSSDQDTEKGHLNDKTAADDTEPFLEVPAHKRKKSKHKGRALLQGCRHLPVEEEVLQMAHQVNEIKIGAAVTEKLAYKPGRFYIRRIIRPKTKNKITGKISIADPIEEPIPKCEADISLLTHVAVSKFVDHLPEYRQREISKREGVIIPSSTMNGWTHRTGELVAHMANHIEADILKLDYIQMDESTIRVMVGKKQRTHLGYMWVINSPHTGYVLFRYFPGRNREGPEKLLDSFSGTLQADGYQVYENIAAINAEIELTNCMAHARRKFDEALNTNKSKAREMLVMLQKLYAIESEIRESGISDPIYVKAKRKNAKPVLKKIYRWLQKNKDEPTIIGKLAEAIRYMLKRWPKLCRYKNDGRLMIDNNLVENSIRPLALGRKNYLFAGNHQAAENYAHFYTIFGTCKKSMVNPYDYLYWYLQRIAQTSIQEIGSLTPQKFIEWNKRYAKKTAE